MTGETTLVDPSLFPRLVIRSGGRVVQEVELRKDVTIGRAEDNDVQLGDPRSSRHHARVQREGAAFILIDLGSANGTRVNGVLVTKDHVLQHGERITIGDTEMTYQEPGRAAQDTAPMKVVSAPRATVAVPAPTQGGGVSRGLIAGLVLIGLVVIVGIAAALLFLIRPDVLQDIGLVSPTETTLVVSDETPTQSMTTEPPTEPSPAATQAAIPTEARPDTAEIDDLLTQGAALARRSKFEEAEAIYEELTSRVPDDARPEIGWAWALVLDNRPADALSHAERAVALDPNSSAAAAVASRVYSALDEVEQAVDFGQGAVDLDPGSSVAHAVLAEAYMLDGQLQLAVDEADLALVQDINNAEAHRVRGWLYHIVDNDMGRAAGELQIAAGLEPEQWMRRHDLGTFLLRAEDYVTAIMAFQDALGIWPKAVSYAGIGEAYYRLGQYDQARASLLQAVTLGADDASTYGLLAAALAHADRCQDAEPYYTQALEQDADQPLAQEALDLCERGVPPPTPTATSPAASAPTPVATPEGSGQARATARPAQISGRIAFPVWNQQTSKYDVYLANVDGSGRRLVTAEMHQPAINQAGNWLAVNGERADHQNLFIVRPDGSQLIEITTNIEDGLPDWSPDGKSLVFSSTRHGDKQSRIYILDDVPFEGGRLEGRTLNFGPDDVRGEYPTWTLDGRIVYSGCDLTIEPAPCGLYIMSAAPGAHPFKQLTDRKEDTAPSAHGDRLAFMSNREGNWEIYLINLDGSGLQRLTKNAANDGLPTWSPDGKTIAFVSDQGGAWAVWAMSLDGSNQRKLFPIGGGGLVSGWQSERIDWAP
ncbi:MAG: PD40 domain-containing protein [Anaerolineae bacterium]|nr:PD40 domain-containing protein [Anaerolineae bacterium]